MINKLGNAKVIYLVNWKKKAQNEKERTKGCSSRLPSTIRKG